LNCHAGTHIDWEGEYESEKRAEERLLIIVPLTILWILYPFSTRWFRSFKMGFAYSWQTWRWRRSAATPRPVDQWHASSACPPA